MKSHLTAWAFALAIGTVSAQTVTPLDMLLNSDANYGQAINASGEVAGRSVEAYTGYATIFRYST